jgi:hypothetical protein
MINLLQENIKIKSQPANSTFVSRTSRHTSIHICNYTQRVYFAKALTVL